jgi:hypothetical protein
MHVGIRAAILVHRGTVTAASVRARRRRPEPASVASGGRLPARLARAPTLSACTAITQGGAPACSGVHPSLWEWTRRGTPHAPSITRHSSPSAWISRVCGVLLHTWGRHAIRCSAAPSISQPARRANSVGVNARSSPWPFSRHRSRQQRWRRCQWRQRGSRRNYTRTRCRSAAM